MVSEVLEKCSQGSKLSDTLQFMKFHISAGDLPTWLAVAAAIYAGMGASKLLKIESKRDMAIEERETKTQANQVAGWIRPYVESTEYLTGSLRAKVSNPSLQPIYKVEVTWWLNEEGISTVGVDSIPPGGDYEWSLAETLPKQYFPDLDLEGYGNPQHALEMAQELANHLRLVFSFTDSTGIRWKRNAEGKLDRSAT